MNMTKNIEKLGFILTRSFLYYIN